MDFRLIRLSLSPRAPNKRKVYRCYRTSKRHVVLFLLLPYPSVNPRRPRLTDVISFYFGIEARGSRGNRIEIILRQEEEEKNEESRAKSRLRVRCFFFRARMNFKEGEREKGICSFCFSPLIFSNFLPLRVHEQRASLNFLFYESNLGLSTTSSVSPGKIRFVDGGFRQNAFGFPWNDFSIGILFDSRKKLDIKANRSSTLAHK